MAGDVNRDAEDRGGTVDGGGAAGGGQVRPDLRAARIAETEERILLAATRLFLADGYPATTLVAVATAAGVAARTVYLRFGTKAALLKRAVDVAIVGDTGPIDVAGRQWYRVAFTAPTAAARIAALAAGCRQIMERAGGLLGVATQAEASEPVIAEAGQRGRLATRDSMREFWRSMAADGMLPPGADTGWLGDTTALLAGADTYLLIGRILGHTPAQYQAWLETTLTRLAAAAETRCPDQSPF
jgi:AcrR family transcriptional regulator